MSLKKVAAKMHVEALKKGRAFRRLRGGLCLTLYYRPSPSDDIVLKLTRSNVQPSDTEIKVCVINFFDNCKVTNEVRKGYAVYLGIDRRNFYGTEIMAKLPKCTILSGTGSLKGKLKKKGGDMKCQKKR